MRNLTLILCVLALTGAVASGSLFFIIGDSKQQLYRQLTNAPARADSLTAELAAADQTSQARQTRIHDLDAQLAASKRELTDVRDETAQLQQALDLAAQQFAQASADAERFQQESIVARRELQSTRHQLAASVSTSEAARYRATIVQLESHIADLEDASAKKIAPASLVAERAHHAQVVGVGPQNAFVVINFGQKHGAVPNQQFHISRGTDTLARVKISATRDNYSIAQILPQTLSGKLRKGNAVTLTP